MPLSRLSVVVTSLPARLGLELQIDRFYYQPQLASLQRRYLQKVKQKKQQNFHPAALVSLFQIYFFLVNQCTLAEYSNWYIEGTMTSVRKVAKVRPKITVQLMGAQNTALSPPK